MLDRLRPIQFVGGAWLAWLISWLVASLWRDRAELGSAYDDYARRVAMLMPFIGRTTTRWGQTNGPGR